MEIRAREGAGAAIGNMAAAIGNMAATIGNMAATIGNITTTRPTDGRESHPVVRLDFKSGEGRSTSLVGSTPPLFRPSAAPWLPPIRRRPGRPGENHRDGKKTCPGDGGFVVRSPRQARDSRRVSHLTTSAPSMRASGPEL